MTLFPPVRDKGSLELCSPRDQLRGQDGWRLSYWNKDNHRGRNDNFDYSNDDLINLMMMSMVVTIMITVVIIIILKILTMIIRARWVVVTFVYKFKHK